MKKNIGNSHQEVIEYAEAQLERMRKRETRLNYRMAFADHYEEIAIMAPGSPNADEFKKALMERLGFSEELAEFCMNHRINIEIKQSLVEKLQQVSRQIKRYEQQKDSPAEIDKLLRKQLSAARDELGDERRTQIKEE